MSYISVHNHVDKDSNLRLKDSIVKSKDLLLYANELGLKGVAFTGHDGCQSHIDALKLTKEFKAKGLLAEDFKTILGVEFYVVEKDENFFNQKENNEKIDFYHLIVLAKNERGHEALRKLSSRGWEESFVYKGLERIPIYKDYLREISNEYKGDLVVSSACIGGELGKLSLKYLQEEDLEIKKKIHLFVSEMKYLFGEDFYLELQPSSQEEQIEYNRFLLKLSKAYDIKPIVTCDTHYLKQEYKVFHHYFLNSKDGDRETEDFYSSTFLHSPEQIIDSLSDYMSLEDINTLFNNTLEIGAKIEEYDLQKEIRIPEANIHEFELKHLFHMFYKQYEYIEKYAFSEHEVDKFFLHLLEKGFIEKNLEFNTINLERLNEELETFWKISENLQQQLSGYLVLTREIIHEILWKCSYVGVSRGSASGSLCNYLIDIVQLNPLKHNLPFYRFISVDRPEFPDIDIDSQTSKRNEIIETMKDKYDTEDVKKVINIGTFSMAKAKSAVQTACKGIGLDTDTTENIKKLATHPTIADCLHGNEEDGLEPLEDFIAEINKYEGLREAIELFENLVVGRSQHASGE